MKRLFVAMPYGKRKGPLDYEKPTQTREIDFDEVWKDMIKPAVPDGFVTKRADELRQPGLIDRLYNEWLFSADIVLADLTFDNPNVYYELGIRQALSKKGTVLVACKGVQLPFDLRNQYVIYYNYFAAPSLLKFQTELRQSIENASGQELDSPVHVFLPGLSVELSQDGKPASERARELELRVQELESALRKQRQKDDSERMLQKVQEASTRPRLLSLYSVISSRATRSVRMLEQLAVRLRSVGCFEEALLTLGRALEIDPNDPELLREIGFVYRKKGPEFYLQAEDYMERALSLNDHDFELHGMLGGLYRRRGEYERALREYKRAHELEPVELYPLVTSAAMCGALKRVEESKEWYKRLQLTCDRLIAEQRADHWAYLCLGQAAVALGDQNAAHRAYQKALDDEPPVEHVRSEVEQLEFLVEKNFAAKNARMVLPMLQEYLVAHDSQR